MLSLDTKELAELESSSETLFPLQEDEINRDVIIQTIVDTFDERNVVILLEGDKNSGKSILLSQFARKFESNTISFFIGEDYWKSNLNYFLKDMCKQMMNFSTPKIKERTKSVDLDTLHKERLKVIFNMLYSDLCNQAKKAGNIFYIVIDGLEKVSFNDTENILNYLPRGDISGVYILISSTKDVGKNYDFKYLPMKAPNFSLLETEYFLNGLLDEEEIIDVYEACKGLPGYVGEIRRQLKLGKYERSEVLSNLPADFERYLERVWNEVETGKEDLLDLLALVAFSKEKLSVENCVEILKFNELKIIGLCEEFSIVSIKDDRLEFIRAYREFFRVKLEHFKISVQQRLISFYEKNIQSEKDVMIYLPDLYRENNDYVKLASLITPETLSDTLKNTNELTIVRKNLKVLGNMSYEAKDWSTLTSSLLVESVFTKISLSPPTIEGEIKALLSLEKYDKALEQILMFSLAEDRIFLMSLVCRAMKKNGKEVPAEILDNIESSISLFDTTVEITEDFIEKVVNICSNIFPVDAEKSLSLLKRVILKADEHIEKEKLMDYMLFKLIINVDYDSDITDFTQIKDQIENEDLHDFLKLTTDVKIDENLDDLYKIVDSINDISAKMFYLINWCENNSINEYLIKVVDYSLDILINSQDYTPTLRQIRRLIATLENQVNNEDLARVINKIELVSATLLRNPIEEYVRLEISLAKIERQNDASGGQERFFEILFYLENIQDLDLKCLSYVYLMKVHNELFTDYSFYFEIKDKFICDFKELLKNSAEHFTVTKKIFYNLSKIEPDLSMELVKEINTENRRYKIYLEMVQSHIKDGEIKYSFIDLIKENFEDQAYREYLTLQIVKQIALNEIRVPQEIINKYLGEINLISVGDLKIVCLSYYMQWKTIDDNKLELAYTGILSNLQTISEVERKDRLGMLIVKNLSEKFYEKAESLYDILIAERTNSRIDDLRLSSLYKDLISLLIRMVPDFFKGSNPRGNIENIKSLINVVSSPYEKAILLSELALRGISENNEVVIKPIINDYIDIIESPDLDLDTFIKIFVETGALLFLADEELFNEYLNHIPSEEYRERTILNTIRYLVSNRPLVDELDFEQLNQKIDYLTAGKICDLIEKLNKDSNIYLSVSVLIDAMLENGGRKSTLRERHLLLISQRVVNIINTKLPDSKNIEHNGYKIASLACLLKLKTIKVKAQREWENLIPKKEDLKEQANAIPNSSDRIFVCSILGKKLALTEPAFSFSLIKGTEGYLEQLNNVIDRMSRYESIAEAYKSLSNDKAATYIIEQAIEIAKACTYENNRDQALGSLIEIAHNISPELAQNYASSLDNNSTSLNLMDKVLSLNLHVNPKKLNELSKSHTQNILHDFFKRTLQSICSERGTIQHEEVVAKSLFNSMGDNFETVLLGVSWYIENTILGNRGRSETVLDQLFINILDLAKFVQKIESIIYNNQVSDISYMNNFHKVFTDSNVKVFDPDGTDTAKVFIKNWIDENSKEYLIIHDPYFNQYQLDILKDIKYDLNISVYSSSKLSVWRDINISYDQHWNVLCDQAPPNINFYFLCSASGETPMHDRFIISEKGGLKLGTSINGFETKTSSVEIMDKNSKDQLQREIIIPLSISPPREHKGQKLLLKTFTW